VKFRDASSGREYDVEVDRTGAVIEARVDGAPATLTALPLGDGTILIECGGRRLRAFAARAGERIAVSVGPHSFMFAPQEPARRGARHTLATPLLTAPMPGKVLKIMVSQGDEVAAGQPLIIIEAMKMETTLAAEGPARVKSIPVAPGQMVEAGSILMELSPLDSLKPQSDR
jgi:biotin carboxyl carrier protein